MLNKEEREAIAKHVLELSSADETEVVIICESLALSRFQHLDIHQNVASDTVHIRIRIVNDSRSGVAVTTRYEDSYLRETLARAHEIAALAPIDPQWPGLPRNGAAQPANATSFVAATAELPIDRQADSVSDVFDVAEQYNVWSAGYTASSVQGITVANSHGRLLSFDGTDAVLNVKENAADATGYGECSTPDITRVNGAAIATVAAEKARQSAGPQEVAAGPLTVILEPVAFGEFLSYLGDHFSAQSVDEGSSCFSWESLDTKLVSDAFTLHEDWTHPLFSGMPFDFEGTPRRAFPLIERGVLRNVVTDARWAARLQRENTGHALPAPNSYGPQPLYMRVAPGAQTRDELIAGVSHGLLISRFWYIRPVDQRKTIVTGMTRDGTFLIRDGKVAGGVRNLRFNQSILSSLAAVTLSSEQVRTSGLGYTLVVPAARIDNFQFSSATSF